MSSTNYTIHRGTVRSQFALYHHVRSIAVRRSNANEALGKATAAVIASEKATSATIVANAFNLRAAQTELKNATARADEASKMHLVPFVAPYVPAKASLVYPALKTCTSQRRAAKYVNDILRGQDDDAREDAWFVQRYAG